MKKTCLSLSRMAVTGIFLCLFGITTGLTGCSSGDDLSGTESGSEMVEVHHLILMEW